MKYLLPFLLVACSHKTTKFDEQVRGGHCDEALFNLPQQDPMFKLVSTTQQAAGTLLSYSAVGLGYTVELLWDVTGGITMAAVACAVPVATSFATKSQTVAAGNAGTCFPLKLNALGAPPIGRRVNEQTKGLRCADLVPFSRSMRQVSSCFQAKGGAADLARAERTLNVIRDSGDFNRCLPAAESAEVQKQLTQIMLAKAALQ